MARSLHNHDEIIELLEYYQLEVIDHESFGTGASLREQVELVYDADIYTYIYVFQLPASSAPPKVRIVKATLVTLGLKTNGFSIIFNA